ncbi:uncharacterized protein LOC108270515 isoform X2 [Ictalurus punctatus]|uniref:Uncharacterized protein LOC108270515 isoform X2 n=1 Tax=Ictalurus punctatus TaxID=7998 RepID=A0A9F7TL55_ICTPU|nr:uncharacterized protein LOC108270515 isoform X2 [Ictalurus punctatus]
MPILGEASKSSLRVAKSGSTRGEADFLYRFFYTASWGAWSLSQGTQEQGREHSGRGANPHSHTMDNLEMPIYLPTTHVFGLGEEIPLRDDAAGPPQDQDPAGSGGAIAALSCPRGPPPGYQRGDGPNAAGQYHRGIQQPLVQPHRSQKIEAVKDYFRRTSKKQTTWTQKKTPPRLQTRTCGGCKPPSLGKAPARLRQPRRKLRPSLHDFPPTRKHPHTHTHTHSHPPDCLE